MLTTRFYKFVSRRRGAIHYIEITPRGVLVKHGRNLLCLFFLLGPLFLAVSSTAPEITVSDQARELHNSAIVIDTHEDTPQRFLDENYDIGSTDPKDPEFITLDKARAGNLGALFFSIFVYPQSNQGHFAQRTLRLIDSVYAQAERHPDQMTMPFSADDIERCHAQHKLALLMGIEGGHSIENDLGLLRDFYRLGVRYMSLTWNNSNEWADSSGDLGEVTVHHHNGLTDFGKQVVVEMNRLGMMADISHVSDKTFWDVLALSKAPVIASHSASRALLDANRNLSDEMMLAVAKNGGVVNVFFASSFLDQSLPTKPRNNMNVCYWPPRNITISGEPPANQSLTRTPGAFTQTGWPKTKSPESRCNL